MISLENIAFSGGAMKTLAFGGVVHAIDKAGYRSQIKRIAATSGGAIVACLMACGFTGEEIMNLMLSRDFSELKTQDSLLENIHRLSFNFGFYSNHLISQWIGDHLEEHSIPRNISFKEVYDKFDVKLIIPVTHLNKRSTVYFNVEDTPDMAIVDATRISTSIPIFFEAYRFKKDYYVDGCITCNLPIEILEQYDPKMERTLAFNVINNNDIHAYREITDIIDFVNEIMNTYFYQFNQNIYKKFKDIIIMINTGDVSAVDFSLPNNEKIKLFRRGYQLTKERLSNLIDYSIPNLFI